MTSNVKSKYRKLFLILFVCIILLLVAFFYFKLSHHINYNKLQRDHKLLLQWTYQHYFLSVIIFIILYILSVISLSPGYIILSLAGGFLFGIFWGTVYVWLGSILGASVVFFVTHTTLGTWFKNRASPWIIKMRQGLRHNAFKYMLILRVTPLFPVWLVNTVPAVLNIPFRIFFTSAVFGGIPSCFFYAAIGNGLTNIIKKQNSIDFRMILTPSVFGSIILLTILSILPVFYKKK